MRFNLLDHTEHLLGLYHTSQNPINQSAQGHFHPVHSCIHSTRFFSTLASEDTVVNWIKCLHGVYILVVGSLLLDVPPVGEISPASIF